MEILIGHLVSEIPARSTVQIRIPSCCCCCSRPCGVRAGVGCPTVPTALGTYVQGRSPPLRQRVDPSSGSQGAGYRNLGHHRIMCTSSSPRCRHKLCYPPSKGRDAKMRYSTLKRHRDDGYSSTTEHRRSPCEKEGRRVTAPQSRVHKHKLFSGYNCRY